MLDIGYSAFSVFILHYPMNHGHEPGCFVVTGEGQAVTLALRLAGHQVILMFLHEFQQPLYDLRMLVCDVDFFRWIMLHIEQQGRIVFFNGPLAPGAGPKKTPWPGLCPGRFGGQGLGFMTHEAYAQRLVLCPMACPMACPII